MKAVRIATALLLALSLCASVSAQGKGKLRLTGKVFNEAGQPVEGADVRAAKNGEPNPQMFEAKTNKVGEWTSRDIAAGEWVIDSTVEHAAHWRAASCTTSWAISTMRDATRAGRERRVFRRHPLDSRPSTHSRR